jgi:hypothetical protein
MEGGAALVRSPRRVSVRGHRTAVLSPAEVVARIAPMVGEVLNGAIGTKTWT